MKRKRKRLKRREGMDKVIPLIAAAVAVAVMPGGLIALGAYLFYKRKKNNGTQEDKTV
jgi:LPXTG-motif cell wall-anchored protein